MIRSEKGSSWHRSWIINSKSPKTKTVQILDSKKSLMSPKTKTLQTLNSKLNHFSNEGFMKRQNSNITRMISSYCDLTGRIQSRVDTTCYKKVKLRKCLPTFYVSAALVYEW